MRRPILPRILALAGSTRRDSYNKKLVRIAAGGAEVAGAEVRVIDLRDFPLPLFDEDLEREEGPPENARRLKALRIESDGLLIASPEYNSSITAVLKNALDWASRPAPGEPPLVASRGKEATLLSVSPGALRGAGEATVVPDVASTHASNESSAPALPTAAGYRSR